jgi:hypothetical protein
MASLTTGRPAIHQWNNTSNTTRPYNFAPGDKIAYRDPINYNNTSIAEVVDIGANGRGGIQLMVHKLEREMIGSKIWRFNSLTCNAIVHYDHVIRHISHDPGIELTKELVRAGWRQIGFAVGCEKYCLVQHENEVTLDLAPGDSDDEEEDVDGIHPEMADFIVPDDEGEAFSKPDPKHLTLEQRKWVNETHAAVRDWENWTPADDSQAAIKGFVDNMAAKYGHMEDERQFTSCGESSSLHKPPSI